MDYEKKWNKLKADLDRVLKQVEQDGNNTPERCPEMIGLRSVLWMMERREREADGDAMSGFEIY